MAITQHFATATLAAVGAKPIPPVPAPPLANPDALASALAAQANAISMQSNAMAAQSLWLTAFGVALGVAAIIAGLVWWHTVKSRAEALAEESAMRWMDENAEQIIAKLDAEIRAKNGHTEPDAAAAAEDLARDGG